MSPNYNTRSAALGSTDQVALRRLKMHEVIKLLGKGLGLLQADPTFPQMHRGTFDEAEILAWKKLRDAPATVPATPLDATTITPRNRRVTERRTPRV